MNELLNTMTTALSGLVTWENLAASLGLAYVILAAKGNIWCWPAALISTIIYTLLFFDVNLYMDSALQVYYIAMAVYGWFCWRNHNSPQSLAQKQQQQNSHTSSILIKRWSLKKHLLAISGLTLISLVLGYIMASHTQADFAYVDSFTTVFAVFSTYLVAQKILENWLYWIVIDAISVYIYFAKSLNTTALLFLLYTVIALWGYWRWRKIYLSQT